MSNLPQRVGNYKIERAIGKGGTSQVLLGRHLTLEDRLVAVKLLLSQDNESIERFAREANIASRLRHENIVQIYDHGYQPPYYYTVMEYVPGGSLRGQLKEGRGLPLETALHVFRSAGIALDYSHAHGVIHRDVSPGNILLEQNTARVLLIDFGIARESGKSGLTTVGNVMGTPGYLSPEHASSATAVTHLSDIFGLGVVLFEMLTGTLPWNHYPGMPPDSNGGAFSAPMSLRQRGVELPQDVDRIIRTMLAFDPAKRYPNAQAAIEELERVLHRHTSTTQIILPGQDGNKKEPGKNERLAIPLSVPATVAEPHPVERVLAIDLLKGPLQEARRRADTLSDPLEIAALLNQWSSEGPFRRRLLGRLATLRRVTSTNIYFYTLRVLYETRSPAVDVEEPDRKAISPPELEKSVDRWEVKLPAANEFKDAGGGTVRLPGSLAVVLCSNCGGIGKTICPRCEGRQRIMVTPEEQGEGQDAAPGKRPAPRPPNNQANSLAPTAVATLQPPMAGPTLVPCPDCNGSGGLRCKPCDGVGRMIQHKVTTWSRKATELKHQDDLPQVEEAWLRQNCQEREVYREQKSGGLRPEWQAIPQLAETLAKAQAPLNPDTRVALSELVVTFIPVTEIVFDLGEARAPAPQPNQNGKQKKPAKPADAGLYSWYIYGFENRLPKDWRFLNWDRVISLIMLALALVLLALFVLALTRMLV